MCIYVYSDFEEELFPLSLPRIIINRLQEQKKGGWNLSAEKITEELQRV